MAGGKRRPGKLSWQRNYRSPSALIRKLDELTQRHADLEDQMGDPAVLSNSQKLVAISKEKGQLEAIVEKYREYRKAVDAVGELTRAWPRTRPIADMAELAAAELPEARAKAGADAGVAEG